MAAAKTTKKAATTTTKKATTAKTTAEKKPVATKKVTKPAVKQEPEIIEEVEEKKGLTVKQKIIAGVTLAVTTITAIAVGRHVGHAEGSAEQAVLDAQKPTEVDVNVYLTDKQAEAEEPVEELEEAADEIEEI